MKRKFIRVLLAVVLALSLVLVMAVPVSADVSGITVANDPQTVGMAAEYTIVFTTTANLFLGSSTITITFPTGTTVPASDITAAKVTVNGTACTVNVVTVTDTSVTITVPKDIPAGSVTVVIDATAGIKNPVAPPVTNLILTVKTSAEIVAVESAPYITIAVEPPYIVSVAGTAYQNSNDTIVITFSEAVVPTGTSWTDGTIGEEFTSIKCGGIALTLASHDFAIDTTNKILTITLDETQNHLEIGTGNLEVIPLTDAIKNTVGDASVGVTPVTGSVTGDTVAPTVALTYSLDRSVKDADTLTVTATFSEAMAVTPTIAIDTQGTDLEATVMAETNSKVWTYGYDVPAASDGTATVTIVGDDLAGNANATATNPNFVIDNTAPTIAVTDILGTTIEDAGDTIVITFSEAVTATWDDSVFTKIESVVDSVATELTLTNAVFAYASGVLTITLDEVTNGAHLMNGETITVTPGAAILDAALNAMSTDAIEGTVDVSGDTAAPTIIRIVGDADANTIMVVFSELVVAADGDWDAATRFSIESPNNAPLNINNATFDPATGMTTVLTLTLDAIDDAWLVADEVILVTPAADAIVDLAGNKLAADEVTSAAVTSAAVWVDDGWSNQTTVDVAELGLTWQMDAFASIQDGIDAAAVGGTVNVLAGEYTEDIIIPATLTGLELVGAGLATTFIQGQAATEGAAAVTILASGVKLHGFTIETSIGFATGTVYGAYVANMAIEVYDNAFLAPARSGAGMITLLATHSGVGTEAVYGASTADVGGTSIHDNTFHSDVTGSSSVGSEGIYVNYNDNITASGIVTIQNNTISGWLMRGIVTERSYTTIDGNTITSEHDANVTDNEGDHAARGILVRSPEGNPNLTQDYVVVTNNTITDFGWGIALGTTSGTGVLTAPITVTNNTLVTCIIGVAVQDEADVPTVNYNSITDSATYGVENIDEGVTLDAENNWWEDILGPGVGSGDPVSADVDYTPWLTASYAFTGEGQLQAGWNLISLPLVPVADSMETMLAELITAGTVNQVRAYNASSKTWSIWATTGPFALSPTLTEMVDGPGYWVEMSAGDDLTAIGYDLFAPPATPPTYSLYEGWNLIGFTSLEENVAGLYLGPAVANTVEAMHRYYASNGQYEGVAIITPENVFENPEFWLLGDLDPPGLWPISYWLEPGEGYWLAVSADGTIYPAVSFDWVWIFDGNGGS